MRQPCKRVTFFHHVLEGSAYDVGRQQGDIIKSIPLLKAWICGGDPAFSPKAFARLCREVETFCPGLNAEIQGVADSLGVPPERIVYLVEAYQRVNHCSHFVVLPGMTADRHLLVGRNYDFNDRMDDLTFMTLRIDGAYAHIGSPGLCFGRNDGMNEYGLVVTMSTGGIPVGRFPGMTPPIRTGFMFWALVRTLLDRCRTVKAALAMIEDFPCAGNPVLLIADRHGQAALVEIWGDQHAVKQIDAGHPEQFLAATNHFNLPGMIPRNPEVMAHSRIRYDAIRTRLGESTPQITTEVVRALLSDPYPDGLCAHYYEESFGTLHSIIFDATAVKAEVCFGAPSCNAWHPFDVSCPETSGAYEATLPLAHASPDFWQAAPRHCA